MPNEDRKKIVRSFPELGTAYWKPPEYYRYVAKFRRKYSKEIGILHSLEKKLEDAPTPLDKLDIYDNYNIWTRHIDNLWKDFLETKNKKNGLTIEES